MKVIFNFIIFTLVCLIVTAVMIVVVVIPNPTEITSYLALSFAIILDAIWLYVIRRRKGSKTISKRLVLWLLAVLYCCFLTDGYMERLISNADI